MNLDNLSDLKKKKWKSIVILLSDGTSHTVTHPDFLFLAPSGDVIFIFTEPDGKRFSIVGRDQIVSIQRDV